MPHSCTRTSTAASTVHPSTDTARQSPRIGSHWQTHAVRRYLVSPLPRLHIRPVRPVTVVQRESEHLMPPAFHRVARRTHSTSHRCRRCSFVHHIPSAQHLPIRRTPRASLHHDRELPTHGSYSDAHSGSTWLASHAQQSHARHQKQLENR